MEMQKPTGSAVQSSVLAYAEKHVLIRDEKDLDEWNIRLANREIFECYADYFGKIIIPNAYYGRGDNAFYTIVDCLFTRDFWKQFTWTGISRGEKCKRGFREYGNVTQLLLCIIQVGDPTYNAQMIEAFCKTKLFRHCKPRSDSRLLRKSTVRPGRGRKGEKGNDKAKKSDRGEREEERDKSVEVRANEEEVKDANGYDEEEEEEEDTDRDASYEESVCEENTGNDS
ncbi:uncharacterized protein LOC129730690 [Wyeomyia smithii]|uniref:uncharacterized protein LOC129730690 n=1 Tax=Wyeomyia smithii TaxID=174621 RepID=UPI002467D08A|nr:uncharacterized protein LOC129730690 [Wyeomyia smithii]XP_055546192.1 uncharacterized protein LOC129730690 [Wyeomyia smithii]